MPTTEGLGPFRSSREVNLPFDDGAGRAETGVYGSLVANRPRHLMRR
jgi:hypothetical protein